MRPVSKSAVTGTCPAVEIRGNMYTLMSLVLQSTNHAEIVRALYTRVQQAPAFLRNTPVIVDFSSTAVPENYNFNLLFKVIRQQNLLPVAVRGLPEHMKDPLQTAGVPVVEQHNARRVAGSDCGLDESGVTLGTPGVTLLIDRSLKKGERCYAPEADLIVVGDCDADNELIADGHIHVYGVLRGNVVAGFQGNRLARIFCRGIQASVVSIAGVTSARPLSEFGTGAPVQVQLDRNSLHVTPLQG